MSAIVPVGDTKHVSVPSATAAPTKAADVRSAVVDVPVLKNVRTVLTVGGLCKFEVQMDGHTLVCVSTEKTATDAAKMWSDLDSSLSQLSRVERDAVREWCEKTPMLHMSKDRKTVPEMYAMNVEELQGKLDTFFLAKVPVGQLSILAEAENQLKKALALKLAVQTEVIPHYEKRIAALQKQQEMEEQLTKFHQTGIATLSVKDMNMTAFEKWARTIPSWQWTCDWDKKWVNFSTPQRPQLLPSASQRPPAAVDQAAWIREKVKEIKTANGEVNFQIVSKTYVKEQGFDKEWYQYVYDAEPEKDLLDHLGMVIAADVFNRKPKNGNAPCCIL